MNEITAVMADTNNVNIEQLAGILSAVRGRIASIPGVAHVEVLARRGMPATARVTMRDGTHVVATGTAAEIFPAGRQPWLPSLDDEFRERRGAAAASWAHPKVMRLPGGTPRAHQAA